MDLSGKPGTFIFSPDQPKLQGLWCSGSSAAVSGCDQKWFEVFQIKFVGNSISRTSQSSPVTMQKENNMHMQAEQQPRNLKNQFRYLVCEEWNALNLFTEIMIHTEFREHSNIKMW